MPYASPFMAAPAWPMYMPSYMPRPLTQSPFLKAQLEELAMRNQDIGPRELEIQRMSQSLNLKALQNARARPATSARGSKSTRRREQAPESASSQLPSKRSQTPSGAPFLRDQRCFSDCGPPTSSQNGASQTMKTVMQGTVKSSLTLLGVIP